MANLSLVAFAKLLGGGKVVPLIHPTVSFSAIDRTQQRYPGEKMN